MKYFTNILGDNKSKKKVLKNIGSGFDNAFATLPAIILMPITINSMIGEELFDISFIICMSGVSTLLFLLLTGRRVLCCLGSSFAFINVTVDMYKLLLKDIENRSEILSYILGAYVFSGFLFIIAAIISKFIPNDLIKMLVPTAVLGPAISLIGLELSSQAINQTYLNKSEFTQEKVLALITIVLVIIISLCKRKHLNNTSIFFAIFLAVLLCAFSSKIEQFTNISLSSWKIPRFTDLPVLGAPNFKFIIPRFKPYCLVMVIPPTLILFCEHTARRIMIDNLLDSLSSENNYHENKICIQRSVLANGLINAINPFFNGVPTTIYAESIAVMRIDQNINSMQFIISSALLCFISVLNPVIFLINNIPEPIIGGVSLVLMGIISVPGLKILIDEKVDYNKLTNLFLSASVLLIGLSDISIKIFNTEIKGMGLGLLSGILLNLVIMVLQYLRLLKNSFTYAEIYEMCQNFPSVFIQNKTQNSAEFIINNNTYAYLETVHNVIYCNIVVKRQYYMQNKEKKFLTESTSINEECVRCYININEVSKETDLIDIINTSYQLCENIQQGQSLFSSISFNDFK